MLKAVVTETDETIRSLTEDKGNNHSLEVTDFRNKLNFPSAAPEKPAAIQSNVTVILISLHKYL